MDHEAIVELFVNRPSLAAELLEETFDVNMPAYTEARVVSANLTDVVPAEYRADLVTILVQGDATVRVNVLEVQLGVDPDKRFSWPVYLTSTRKRHRCAVDLLVIAPEALVAKWCAQPIEIGPPGFVLKPMVLQNQLVPIVTDEAQATRRPELAVLSAIAHGQTDAGPQIAEALVPVLEKLADKDRSTMYLDLVYHSLNEAARRALEAKMLKNYVYTSPFGIKYAEGKTKGRDEGYADGRKEGLDEGRKAGLDEGRKAAKKESLLTILKVRGIDISEGARLRIDNENDVSIVERWLVQAANASSLDEVFKETN